MEINIRPALPSDAPGVADVLLSVEWLTRLRAVSPEELLQRMNRSMESCLADNSHLVLVAADQDSRILGYVAVHWLPYFLLNGAEGYVSELFVHADARGCGVGTLLIERVKDEARLRGCSRLMLINFRERPSYQREFYKKNGWHERETGANFIFELK